jgi:hypothetical protein
VRGQVEEARDYGQESVYKHSVTTGANDS